MILSRRTRALGSSMVKEVLVRWIGMTDSLATWVNLQELLQRFPKAPAWGQAGFQEEGNVMDLPATKARQARKDAEKLLQSLGNAAEEEELRRSRHVRRSAARLSGPEWTV